MKRDMTRAMLLFAAAVALAATAAAGQMSETQQKPSSHKTRQTAPAAPATNDRGEEVFHQNCYRCHQEPRGFPPSVSGAIATHMRVRAGLSDDDYKALLKFLNP